MNCVDRQAYPAQTVLLLRNGEPFVFVDFQKQFPPAQNKGIDDTEHAENLSVYYSQKTKSVKVAKSTPAQMPSAPPDISAALASSVSRCISSR